MTRYSFDDFCLDDASRAQSRAGSPIALTPRVFDTLRHLLLRGGELVEKNELMQVVWPARVVEENNLNEAISALRRALGERRGEQRYILTVPGRGYRFVATVHATVAGQSSSSATSLRSLAVLPFKLLSAAQDNALQIGMADTLITRLSGLGELVVRPLSAVSRFNAEHDNPLRSVVASAWMRYWRARSSWWPQECASACACSTCLRGGRNGPRYLTPKAMTCLPCRTRWRKKRSPRWRCDSPMTSGSG